MADNKEYITYSEGKGSINISEEVIAVIAAHAAGDTEGVAELYGKKGAAKGVRVNIAEAALTIDVFVLVKLGYSVNKVGENIQNAVASEVESATGFPVSAVNVKICGVSLEKDK